MNCKDHISKEVSDKSRKDAQFRYARGRCAGLGNPKNCGQCRHAAIYGSDWQDLLRGLCQSALTCTVIRRLLPQQEQLCSFIPYRICQKCCT